MKKLILWAVFAVFAVVANAQTVSFTLTTPPCHDDGVLTANMTGLTPPLTVQWGTFGMSGTVTTHTGVSSLTDVLTSYSGGEVDIYVTDAASAVAYGYYTGAAPFTYSVTTTSAVCPALATATAVVAGGTSPYTYNWFSFPAMATVGTANPVSLPAGNYGVTITDAAGCTFGSLHYRDSIMIYVTPAFSVPITTTVAACTNGAAAVGAITGGTSPYSYLWSTSATSSFISGLVTGGYTCVVTDAAGCSATGWGYVSQSPTITPMVTPTPATCLATDGAIIAFGSGGVPPYTYMWSNSATTQAQTGLPSGAYYVTVTDANGCYGSGGGYIGTSTPITVSYAATPSLCTSPTGTATLTVSGGTAPYTINWHTTPPHTGLTVTGLAPGNYAFDIVDAVGCVQSGVVNVPPISVITASFSSTSALCLTSTGALSVTPAGGVTPYTYLWSTSATSSSISGVPSGTYSVRITDANSCAVTKYGYVTRNSPLGLGLSSTPASCIFTNDGSITATPYGGTLPYTYIWSGGGSTSTISSLPTGPYNVYVTDAIGCTATGYTYLGYNTAATSCYCTISGTVYNDVNNNCIQDPGEAGIPNIQIYCSGIGYTYTDLSGNYSFIVPSGSYTITETVRAFYPLSSCQTNGIPVTVTASSGCVHTVDFGNTISTIHDMHISTWDYNFAVPGNTYRQVAVISNDGTVTESAALSGYKPDGQFFAPSFVPSAVYSGVPYWYSTPGSFPSITPGGVQTFLVDYFVPSSIPMGTSVLFKDTIAASSPISSWLTDYSPWNNVNYFNTVTVSSYDPNFKEVSPKGVGPTGIITASDTILEYMVHFQNTGTYMAQNIVVIDTLDNNLDWTSLKPVYQSGKCKVTLTQTGSVKVAKFMFANINLPAAVYEPVSSNGMFTYTVKTRRGLPIGTQFKNSASIYFDYNEPVKTNTTVNTLGANLVVNQIAGKEGAFTVYPNPAGQSFNAVINSTEAGNGSLDVYDVTGKLLISKNITLQAGSQTIANDVSQIAPGVYFVTLHSGGNVQTQKLVIMK